ncbi:MAG: RiPP maturation radical SAM protein 1 [Chloroflexi bacterium]|nr:RiPP maturation radical SAM protein 1 [Chloroflexota bacterium]
MFTTKSRGGVALVEMPFRQYYQPAAGLALLKATLEPLHVPAKILYMTLRLAERMGGANYEALTDATNTLVGEWLFAPALFDPAPSDPERYVQEVLFGNSKLYRSTATTGSDKLAVFNQAVEIARGQIDAFLDECLTEVMELAPKLVGFSNSFPQNFASLALAKRIRAHLPGSYIVFGGANCTGVMGLELVRQFPFVDAAVSGEGEIVFPELVRRVLAGQVIGEIPGVYTQSYAARTTADGNSLTHAEMLADLDALPLPEYADYFEQRAKCGDANLRPPQLPFETSRGCWWGERSQCTFCGLNGVSLTFRHKTPRRAWEEFDQTLSKHPVAFVAATDNILDMRYFDEFLPQLAAREHKPILFFEVKANLKKEQVRRLRASQARFIQPGIESPSTPILQLMRKGITALQNVQLLKWCREFGVIPKWNLLWGFPGEPPDEYRRMAEWIPYLTHLNPPENVGAISLERFSPYLQHAEQFGLVNVRPHPIYRHIYPFDEDALANLAFHFSFDYRVPQDVESYTAPVMEQVQMWRNAFATSELFAAELGEILMLCDLRPAAHRGLTALVGRQRQLYLACDAVRSLRGLQRMMQQTGQVATLQEIEAELEPLVDRGLMLREGDNFLSLAISSGEYTPSRSALERFRALLTGQAFTRAGGVQL